MVTKLDVLDTLKEIKICTGYRYKGSLLKSFPPDIKVLQECSPEYKTVRGWARETAGIQDFKALAGAGAGLSEVPVGSGGSGNIRGVDRPGS